MVDVVREYALPWDDGVEIFAEFSLPWDDSEEIVSIGNPFIPPEDPVGTPTNPGNIDPRYIIEAKTHKQTNSVSMTMAEGLDTIPIISLSLGTDVGSVCWTCEVEIGAKYFPDVATIDSQIFEISINGQTWRFVVDRVTRNRAPGATTVRIAGRSVAMISGAPFQAEQNWINNGVTTAAQLCDAANYYTETTILFEMEDWLLPDKLFTYTGTPMMVVQRIAEAVGGLVRSDRFENQLIVSPRYPKLHNQWHTIAPELELHLGAAQTESYERADQPPYNAVYISGQQQGSFGYIRLNGTNGDFVAPLVTDLLLTEMPAIRQRGEAILGAGGKRVNISITIPVLTGPREPGVCDLNWIVHVIDQAKNFGEAREDWWGIIRGVSVTVARDGEALTITQQITLERHLDFIEGTVSENPPPGGNETGGVILQPPPKPGDNPPPPDDDEPVPPPYVPPNDDTDLSAEAEFYLPPMRGERGASILWVEADWADHVGVIQGFDSGSYVSGKDIRTVSEANGVRRNDGSLMFGKAISPYSGRAEIVMNLRGKDSPPSGAAFRTQWQQLDGFGGVRVEAPVFGRQWRVEKVHFNENIRQINSLILLDQNHASKVQSTSWGGVSPPTATQLFVNGTRPDGKKKIGIRAHFIGVDSSHPKGVVGVRPKVSRKVVLVEDVEPGVEYIFVHELNIIDGVVDRPSNGYWACHIGTQEQTGYRTVVIANNEPTMYPYDVGVELNADGSIRPEHCMFWTSSLYTWQPYSRTPAWEATKYIRIHLLRTHQAGMTAAGWFKVMREL